MGFVANVAVLQEFLGFWKELEFFGFLGKNLKPKF